MSGRAGRMEGILNVGLTGNVASGKSTVARQWARAGISVVSADELSREVVAPGTEGLARVVEAFGEEVLAPDGSLDRAALRARVFADPDERRRLEAILHPLITQGRARWLEEREARGDRLLVSEIPLLFEVGLEGEFDRVVVVHASAEERLRRLVDGRGLEPDEARRIMEAQGDPDDKRRKADHVLDNDGTPEELARAGRALLDRLAAEAGETMVLDLHLHTRGSWDCLSDPEEVLEQALARGVHRIAITDHDRLGVALEMARRHPGLVIPGEEVKTAEGVDVIGLYLSEEIPGGTPAREVCRRIRAQGGLAYLPHPFASLKGAAGKGASRGGSEGASGRRASEGDASGSFVDTLARQVDVVEVFNARLRSDEANRRAEELAQRHGRLRGAGSDAHTVGEVGNGRVIVPWHANSAEALASALSRARIEGERAPLKVFLASNWAKVRKRLPGAPSSGIRPEPTEPTHPT